MRNVLWCYADAPSQGTWRRNPSENSSHGPPGAPRLDLLHPHSSPQGKPRHGLSLRRLNRPLVTMSNPCPSPTQGARYFWATNTPVYVRKAIANAQNWQGYLHDRNTLVTRLLIEADSNKCVLVNGRVPGLGGDRGPHRRLVCTGGTALWPRQW